MTPALVAASVVMLCAFATGIFYVLSSIQKPVWALMMNRESTGVREADVRFVHEAMQRVIPLLPPTMLTTVLTTMGLLGWQATMRGFDAASLIVLAWFLGWFAWIISQLRGRIRDVRDVPLDADPAALRRGVGMLARLHHTGMFTTVTTLLLQLGLIVAP